jgi:hypothetical protein
MTNYIRYGVDCLRIPHHAIPRALLKLNLLWRDEKQNILDNYAHVTIPENDTFTSLCHAFSVFGFFSGNLSTLFINEDGDHIISGLAIKRLEYEEIILRKLATCIDDCFIEVIDDDDGTTWEWVIDEGLFYKYMEPRDIVLDMEGLQLGCEVETNEEHTLTFEPKAPTEWDTL